MSEPVTGEAVVNAVTVHIQAPADAVYDLVSDVTRMGEWSPECVGGEWIDGATSAVEGARFKATNKRKGKWTTTSTVTAAERGRTFAFSVGKGETLWHYAFVSTHDGCDVTERFEIVKEPGPVGRFFTKVGTGVAWDRRAADLYDGMRTTLVRLKEAAEAGR